MEHNIRNIFLERSHTKCGGVTSLRLFSEKIEIENISGSIVWSFIQFVFVVSQDEDYQNILKLSCRCTCFYLLLSIFRK